MTYATVRSATSPELAYLRTAGQYSRLYLAIFKPSSVYTATLSVVPSSNDRVTEVSFTGGSGTLADVLPDMSMYVGSSAGAYDLGIARIRKSPIAGTFYVGETSEVYWTNPGTVYLTVVNDFDLWAKHIVTVDDTTFYMDTDITYTDQNDVLNPVPIMGGHRVLRLTGANVSTQFDFSNSYCIGSSVSGYSVACSTATITGGTTSTPTLQFSAAGWHMVVLTVTAANGKTSVGVRYVYVYSTASPPATVFQLGSCSGDYETGGWNFSVTMQSEIGLSDVPERALCILFAEDYYGDSQVSIGQLAGCENVLVVGKIAEEAISINPEQSEVTLQVQGMQHWFEQVNAFPTGVLMTTSTPTNWAEMSNPTVDKVLFRLFYWGCTATKIMDIYLTNDVKLATELTAPSSNLWAQVQEIAMTTIQARSGVDRFGRMFIEVEPQVVPVVDRTWATVMTLGKGDWHDSVKMQRVIVSSTGMINSSGVVIASDASGNALFSLAPGHVFKHYGATEVLDRLLLSTQFLSNQLAGLVLNWRNNTYPSSEFNLSANNRMVDCFPRQRVQWSVSAGDSPRGFSFNKGFIPRRVEFHWDDGTGWLETSLSLEMEVSEGVYIDGDIPGDGGVDLGRPPAPPAFPPIPDFPVIWGSDIPAGNKRALLYSDNYGFLYTENFDAASPTWVTMNGGLGALAPDGNELYKTMGRYFVCPNGAVYAARLGTLKGTPPTSSYAHIYRAPYPGGTWSLVLDATSPVFSGSPPVFAFWGILNIGYSPVASEQVVYVIREGGGPSNRAYIGAGTSFTAGATGVPDSGGGSLAGGAISYGFGKWVGVTSNRWFDLGAAAASVVSSTPDVRIELLVFSGIQPELVRAGTSNICYVCSGGGDFLYSPDNLTTLTQITVSGFKFEGFASDATGQFLMTQFTSGTGYKAKSTDYGATWTPLTALPSGTWYFHNIEGANKWIAAGGTSVRSTEDGGNTWLNKEGNIVAGFPLISIVRPFWSG